MPLHARILLFLLLLAQPLLGWSTHAQPCVCAPVAATVHQSACAYGSDACCCDSPAPQRPDCESGCAEQCELCRCAPIDTKPAAPAVPARTDSTDSGPKYFEAAPQVTLITFDYIAALMRLSPTRVADDRTEAVSARLARLCVWTT